jgi:hypothetical protein
MTLRHIIPPDRVRQLGSAVAAAVRLTGTPRTPEVERLLRGTVQELLDAGASASEVHDLLGPLFQQLRAPYAASEVRVALDILLTQLRSFALEHDYRLGDQPPPGAPPRGPA